VGHPLVFVEVSIIDTASTSVTKGIRLIPALPRFEFLFLEFYERTQYTLPTKESKEFEEVVLTFGWPTHIHILQGVIRGQNLTDPYPSLLDSADMQARAKALDDPDMIAFINGK
jgi:hypothetical protein